MNRAERVLAFLEEQPDVWIEATRFEAPGGRQAWRTAISEARTLAKGKGWDIVNRQRRQKVDGREWTLSEYLLATHPVTYHDPRRGPVVVPCEAESWREIFGERG